MPQFRWLVLTAMLVCGSEGRTEVATEAFPSDLEVEIVKNLAYKEGPDADPVRHRLDLYLPKGKKGFPVILFVHGGRWSSGSKDLYGKLGELYAKHGVGMVIINYRLSPQVVHPAHVQDVASAFAWTVSHVGKYGGDAKNLFLCGHSAGGHLVALLSTNEKYLNAEKLASTNIKGVIPISGVYVLPPAAPLKSIFTDDPMVVKSASPIESVKGKHPPFLILYADKDYATLDIQAEQMCKKLSRCECEATAYKIENRDHISIITRMVEFSDPVNQRIFDMLVKQGGLTARPQEK
jgi:acetyl esterase/lipase